MSQVGHGAIAVTIAPNPIIAQPAGGGTFEFPFDVIVRETGGHNVTINDVTVTVFAFGGVQVGSDQYDASRIKALGYTTMVPANGEVRYHFQPRKSVPDERLFSSVTADVGIDGVDDTGAPTRATTSVTVRR